MSKAFKISAIPQAKFRWKHPSEDQCDFQFTFLT
jgi:hypothetical protein